MNSPGPPVQSRKELLARSQSIYDQHRYLDAFHESAPYWTNATDITTLSAEELIFGGRLASRLGASRLSRHLYRKALALAPELPIVRYFTNHLQSSRIFLLDELRDFEKDPELGGDDDELRASWLVSRAHTYAALRDYSRAYELLNRAQEIAPGSAWVLSQLADVYGMADRWQEALESAEDGCRADPHSPWPTLSLASALLNLGRVREAAERTAKAAKNTQYFHVVQSACWYHCALAETLEEDERRHVLLTARELAERIAPLATLGDREFSTALARTWLDLAEMNDDHAAMERWAREARSTFHAKVLANLRSNPNGKRLRLPYRRTVQKHVECVPTSISSALSATGVELSVEELAREVTFGGTWDWAAAGWLRERGFHVRFFSATPEIISRLIEARIGFTVSWDDDESGHTVAVVGVDQAAGTVIAHDPSSFRSTEYLLTRFQPDYSPVGVLAMAIVPPSLSETLDALLPADAAIAEAFQAQQEAHANSGSRSGLPIAEGIRKQFPTAPGAIYLEAIQNLEDGRAGRVLQSFQQLIGRFPTSPAVRTRLMAACRTLGDTALLLQTLRSIVATGRVPGTTSTEEWSEPHQRYVYEYADLLRRSAGGLSEAESLLRRTLTRNARAAGAWHTLADMKWQHVEQESALLAYRIASTLADHNEHYAAAYADVLRRSGRVSEAREWLRARAHRLGTSTHGVSTWITYIDNLEDWGDPVAALEVCRDVLTRFDDSSALLVFTVPFLARMGQWKESEQWLRALQALQSEARFREASVYFWEMRGSINDALEHAEAWVREAPLSTPARRKLLGLLSTLGGQEAALARATEWMRERPENEDFEELFCDYVDFPAWRKLRVLRLRVKRNPDDAWAWRELVFTLVPKYEGGSEAQRRRLRGKIDGYLAEAERLTSGDAPTLRAQALWLEAQGKWKLAQTGYMEAVWRDTGNSWCYNKLFELSARFSAAEQQALWPELEPLWLGNSGHLPHCLGIMRHLKELCGPRETEKIIANWQALRPGDPNVAEALADLLLDFGQGRSDAKRALELLRDTVTRYPYHSGLRFSLARALRATGDDNGAGQVFEQMVQYRPDDLAARIQLAWIRDREGDAEEGLRIVREAAQEHPQSVDLIDTQAQLLIECDRFKEAVKIIEDGLNRLPRSIQMYQRAIALFLCCGQTEKRSRQHGREWLRIRAARTFGCCLGECYGRILILRPQGRWNFVCARVCN